MKTGITKSPHRKWAEFRHSVVGPLLSAPPAKGELAGEIRKLAAKDWKHPVSGEEARFEFSTIEAWYYLVKREHHDPIGKLASRVRSDLGRSRKINHEVDDLIRSRYKKSPYWNYKLHSDNLAVEMKEQNLGKPPAYSTVRRFMKQNGLTKKKRVRHSNRYGYADALRKGEMRETRSYEVEFVGGLSHLDFHHGSLQVINAKGQWQTPILLGIFDDHSRLCCHMQWFLGETTADLTHGFIQSILKRGVPRELLTDNGSAMVSEEFTQGLSRLGIEHKRTLPYHPEQNGKCEHVWSKVESRLMAMLYGHKDLDLKTLNNITQAWVEMEYNRQYHDELKARPIDRFIDAKDVYRPAPSVEYLRSVFRREIPRKQRRSDGTVVVCGQRFEIPSQYRHLENIVIRYASWDLSLVHMIDERTGKDSCRLYPLDKNKNADGRRRTIEKPLDVQPVTQTTELPPLLRKYMNDYAQTGAMPSYIPKNEASNKDKNNEC